MQKAYSGCFFVSQNQSRVSLPCWFLILTVNLSGSRGSVIPEAMVLLKTSCFPFSTKTFSFPRLVSSKKYSASYSWLLSSWFLIPKEKTTKPFCKESEYIPSAKKAIVWLLEALGETKCRKTSAMLNREMNRQERTVVLVSGFNQFPSRQQRPMLRKKMPPKARAR